MSVSRFAANDAKLKTAGLLQLLTLSGHILLFWLRTTLGTSWIRVLHFENVEEVVGGEFFLRLWTCI